jgi:hypothetical protein
MFSKKSISLFLAMLAFASLPLSLPSSAVEKIFSREERDQQAVDAYNAVLAIYGKAAANKDSRLKSSTKDGYTIIPLDDPDIASDLIRDYGSDAQKGGPKVVPKGQFEKESKNKLTFFCGMASFGSANNNNFVSARDRFRHLVAHGHLREFSSVWDLCGGSAARPSDLLPGRSLEYSAWYRTYNLDSPTAPGIVVQVCAPNDDAVINRQKIDALQAGYGKLIPEVVDPNRELAPWEKLMKHVLQNRKLLAASIGYDVILDNTNIPTVTICRPKGIIFNQEGQQVAHTTEEKISPFIVSIGKGWGVDSEKVDADTPPTSMKIDRPELYTTISLT